MGSDNQVEAVKAALSISTCSSSTVKVLQDLLSVNNSRDASAKGAQTNTKAPPTRRTVQKQEKTTAVEVHDGSSPLSPKERFKLATEIVNTTLKVLTDALKPQPKAHRRVSSTKNDAGKSPTLRRSSSATNIRSLSRSSSWTQQPLAPISANEVAKSATKPRHSRRTSSYCSSTGKMGPSSGLVAIASCSRVAFSHLRTVSSKDTGVKGLPSLQVETGMLALIGKLIAHGMETEAFKELAILKKRFEGMSGKSQPPGARPKTATGSSPERETLASLLHVTIQEPDQAVLQLLVTYHNSVLKLITHSRRPSLIEAAASYLAVLDQPSLEETPGPFSPCRTIFYLLKMSGESDRAVKQLDMLARTILGLCPSAAASADPLAINPKLSPSPGVIFRLQAIVLSTQKLWWSLAGHRADDEKELLQPLSRYIDAYARRCEPAAKASAYTLVKQTFMDLVGPEARSSGAFCSIHSELGSFAQKAGKLDEAIEWIEKAIRASSADRLSARALGCNMRLLSLYLTRDQDNLALSTKVQLEHCIATFQEGVKGDHANLHALVQEIAGIRRALMKQLSEVLCCRLVFQTTRFLAKFAASGLQDRQQHRETLIQKLGGPFVDTSLLACKALLSDKPDWDDIQSALTHTISVAEFAGAEGAHVKISNMYMLCYQKAERQPGKEQHALHFLKKSVELLQERSAIEQLDGLLALKMERLGELLRASKDMQSAHDAFTGAFKVHVLTGTLRKVADASQQQPIHAAITQDTATQMLSRCLHQLYRTSTNVGLGTSIVDDEQLEVRDRAALLEMQLIFLESSRAGDAGVVLGKLLGMYNPQTHPVRRARICTRILCSAQERPATIGQDIVALANEYTLDHEGLGADENLERFKRHQGYCLHIAKAFNSAQPSVDDLNEPLLYWQTVIDQATSWKALQQAVDDFEVLISMLHTMASYLEMQAEDKPCLVILRLLYRLEELRQPQDSSKFLQSSAELALQYLRMGYSGEAERVFSVSEGHLDKPNASARARIQWHLANAEYLIHVGNADKAAFELGQVDSNSLMSNNGFNTRHAKETACANTAYVQSLLSLAAGSPNQALVQAKRSARIYQAVLDSHNRRAKQRSLSRDHVPESEVGNLVTGINNLAISVTDQSRHPQPEASCNSTLEQAGWAMVPPLFRSLLHLSTMYSYEGHYPEARYYADQAEKLAVSVKSTKLGLIVSTLQTEHTAASGIRQDSDECNDLQDPRTDVVKYLLARGRKFECSEAWEEALTEYGKAERMAAALASIAVPDKFGTKQAQFASDAMGLSVPEKPVKRIPKAATTGRSRTAKPIVPTGARPRKATTTTAPAAPGYTTDRLPILALQGTALRQKAVVLMKQGDVASATALLKEAESMLYGSEDKTKQQIAVTSSLMLKAANQIASDFTYNILPESTISFPALSASERRQSQPGAPRSSLLSPAQAHKVPSPKKVRGTKHLEKEQFALTLRDARENIVNIQMKASSASSTAVVHQVCSMASAVTVLLSATNQALPKGSLHPVRAACSMEMPRIEALQREIAAVAMDKRTESRQELLTIAPFSIVQPHPSLSAAQFQREYVDIIPDPWTAVSLGLSEDCTELYITRYHAKQTPFILRLPLTRNKGEDLDEESGFDFEAGRAELKDIISLSDYSCHHAPDSSVKGTRTAWWAEREALDRRLHELLVNVENIWLGGFRGILSQHTSQPSLLARFRKSFENILDRHLPSRQGAKARGKKLSLDPRVLELFIGLGDDKDGAVDLDEHLLDLLYFVIDILQFHGERNAYDEVDFDSMTVETLDALRSYHEASAAVETADKHMILILDKRLHSFPWESLPCLERVNVSRVGSMLTLRERILAMRRQQRSNNDNTERYSISASSGTYILNPGSDLKATQATLEPLLSTLKERTSSTWTPLVNRAPSEIDFTSALSRSNMLLYFGHGSGSQYVRNRAIKKLDGCSDVVWLMGCSSGAVVEYGDFEPVSVPLSYLVAGRSPPPEKADEELSGRDGLCMAVVATLWDVTDKDIDRFSVAVGEEWGLWAPAQEEVVPAMPKTPARRGRAEPKTPKTPKTPGRSRSRTAAKAEKENAERKAEKKSLVEAVVKGRSACYLRYLNGAAAVVYGVPVYLGD